MIRKFEWIDATRGYAVLGVVAVHSLMGEKEVFLSNFLNLGAKGVQLFYIASAFTLLLSWNNRKEESNPILNFFLRRFFRIAPMFYLAIIFWLFCTHNINYSISNYKYISSWSMTTHFMFLHGLSPYWQDSLVPGGWSVGVEYIFYAFCPLFFLKVNSYNKAIIWYVISAYAGTIVVLYLKSFPLIPYKDTWNGYLYGFFPAQANVFFAGFLFFYLQKLDVKQQLLTLIKVGVYILPLLVVGVVYNLKSGLEINFLVTFVFIIFLIMIKNDRFNLLCPKFLQYIGRLSYSIYLVHFGVLFFLEKYNLTNFINGITINYLIRFLIILITSISISYFSYNYIEQPFLSFGKRIIKKLEKKSYENMFNIRS
jgi:peptidoglycan/LPS O-acetylase OafA/YrhL